MAYERTTHMGACPICNGSGKQQVNSTAIFVSCLRCGGSGSVVTGVTERTTWPDQPYAPSKSSNNTNG